jgi:Uma2 family endonuclease
VEPTVYRFKEEVDLLLREPDRLVTPDLAVYTNEAVARQRQLVADEGLASLPAKYRPMFVMPQLVVESVSKGYVRHDRVTKRRWYAEAGIPHYWILDGSDQSIEVLVLVGGQYRLERRLTRPATLSSEALGAVTVDLDHVFPD